MAFWVISEEQKLRFCSKLCSGLASDQKFTAFYAFHRTKASLLCTVKNTRKMRILLLIASLTFSSASFGQNEFSFDLFKTMEQDENLLFSPTSIKAALAMAYDGANGETQKEFEEVLGFDEENELFLKELAHLKESAEISNSVWILEDYKVLKAYIDSLQSRCCRLFRWLQPNGRSHSPPHKVLLV